MEHLSIAILVLKPIYSKHAVVDFEWQAMNKKASEINPQFSEQLIGQNLLEHTPLLKGSPLLRQFLKAVHTGKLISTDAFFSAKQYVTKRDIWYKISAKSHEDFLVVTFEDITEQKRLQNQIEAMVYLDALTGIHNRRYFQQEASKQLSLGKRHNWSCGLIFFDLNNFKEVNDTYGHEYGDLLLKAVAKRLAPVLRKEDIFFRLGGDEFALFMSKVDTKTTEETAKRLASLFVKPFELKGSSFLVSASIGFTVMSCKKATIRALLAQADKAMYAAKANKRAGVTTLSSWQKREPISVAN